MRRRIVALTVAALLTGAAGVSAQIYAPQTLERYFRLEWDVTRGRKGPVVEGYVYNTGPLNAERMRLQIECLDASGRAFGSSTVWVLGLVPMDGRAYFRASVCLQHRLGPHGWPGLLPRVRVRRGQLPRAGAVLRLGPQRWWRRRRGVSQSTDRRPQRESRPDTGP